MYVQLLPFKAKPIHERLTISNVLICGLFYHWYFYFSPNQEAGIVKKEKEKKKSICPTITCIKASAAAAAVPSAS